MKVFRSAFGLFRMMFAPLRKFSAKLDLKWGGDSAKRRKRSHQLATAMLHEFSRLGFVKRIDVSQKGRRRVVRQRVQFEYPLLMTKDELWCPIFISKLPYGVSTDALCDASVLRSMEDRLDCSVRVDKLASGKLCFVARLGGHRFPAIYNINNSPIPTDSAPLTIPMGVSGEGDPVLLDLVELKHLLIAGATGGGKTTLQHAIITTLLQRNGLNDIELWLIDLKRTEFNLYRPVLGHAVRSIAVEPNEAVELLDNCYREIVRRNQFMERHGATNLEDLSKTANIKLKRIVLMVDEFAILTTDSTRLGRESIGSIATRLMTRIASLGRSAGVTITIATQMVNKDVLSGTIRANFENRICFSTSDWRQSQLVVESSEADGIPKGRAILRVEGRTQEVQTCFITPRQVRIEVSRIAEFGPTGTGDDEELVRYVRHSQLLITAACQQFNGAFNRSKLLQLEGIRGVVSQDTFNEIAQRLERDGILTPARGKTPRKVAPGFYNRANLLDHMYGLSVQPQANSTQPQPNHNPTTNLEDPLWFEEPATIPAHTEALSDAVGDTAVVVPGSQIENSHDVSDLHEEPSEEPQEDEDGLGPFRRAIGE